MSFHSILNDVLGPVMRGPSSSHTAGSHRIGRLARDLLGGEPAAALFRFDPGGSYARTYREQGANLGFAGGLLGWDIQDPRFPRALELAEAGGVSLDFGVERFEGGGDHPNTVRMSLRSKDGRGLEATAASTGGGGFLFSDIDGFPVALDGKSHALLLRVARGAEDEAAASWRGERGEVARTRSAAGEDALWVFCSPQPFDAADVEYWKSRPGVRTVRTAGAAYHVRKGETLAASGSQLAALAERYRGSLGRAALARESALLGMSEEQATAELLSRYRVMKASVAGGLSGEGLRLRLLSPSAKGVLEAERSGRLAVGGPHARAAARALAVLHVANSGGVVCAAPTGASSGVLPAVLTTLEEDSGLDESGIALALWAAGAAGLVVALRATFAAEVAGCQVEIGAAGAMAAAACVEAAGGGASLAMDAAAVALQNAMGSVCDPVQGRCEIPCHTRNAAAASGAMTAADLVLGGYVNPIPLDETVDAVLATGRLMPCELRCTSRGGLAVVPSALLLGGRARPGEGAEP